MLVLPTKTIPNGLTEFITADGPSRKILNGFRNKITANFKLVLVKNDNSCAQAFSYNLKDDEALLEKLKSF